MDGQRGGTPGTSETTTPGGAAPGLDTDLSSKLQSLRQYNESLKKILSQSKRRGGDSGSGKPVTPIQPPRLTPEGTGPVSRGGAGMESDAAGERKVASDPPTPVETPKRPVSSKPAHQVRFSPEVEVLEENKDEELPTPDAKPPSRGERDLDRVPASGGAKLQQPLMSSVGDSEGDRIPESAISGSGSASKIATPQRRAPTVDRSTTVPPQTLYARSPTDFRTLSPLRGSSTMISPLPSRIETIRDSFHSPTLDQLDMETRLDQMQVSLESRNDDVRALRARVGELEFQVDDLQHKLHFKTIERDVTVSSLEKQLRVLSTENQLLQGKGEHHLAAHVEELRSQMKQILSENGTFSTKIEDMTLERTSFLSRQETIVARLKEEFDKNLAVAQSERHAAAREASELRSRLTSATARLLNAETRAEELQNELEKEDEMQERLVRERDEAQEIAERSEEELGALHEKLQSLYDELERVQAEKGDLQFTIREYEERVQIEGDTSTRFTEEHEELTQRLKEEKEMSERVLKDRVKTLQTQLSHANMQVENSARARQSLQAEIDSLRARYDATVAEKLKEAEQFQRTISELEAESSSCHARIQAVQREKIVQFERTQAIQRELQKKIVSLNGEIEDLQRSSLQTHASSREAHSQLQAEKDEVSLHVVELESTLKMRESEIKGLEKRILALSEDREVDYETFMEQEKAFEDERVELKRLFDEQMQQFRHLQQLYDSLKQEKESIEDEMESLRESSALEKDRTAVQFSTLQETISHLNSQVEEYRVHIDQVREELTNAKVAKATLEKELSHLKTRIANEQMSSKSAQHRLQMQLTAHTEEIDALNDKLRSVIAERDEVIRQLREQLGMLHSRHEEAATQLQTLSVSHVQESTERKEREEDLETQNSILTGRLDTLENTLHRERENYSSEKAALQKSLKTAEAKLEDYIHRIEEITSQRDEAEAQVEALEKDAERKSVIAKDRIQSLEKELSRLRISLEESRGQVSSTGTERESFLSQRKLLQAEIDELHKQVDLLQREKSQQQQVLQKQLAATRAEMNELYDRIQAVQREKAVAVQQLNGQIKNMEARNGKQAMQIEALQEELRKARSELRELDSAMLSERETRGNELEKMSLELKESKRTVSILREQVTELEETRSQTVSHTENLEKTVETQRVEFVESAENTQRALKSVEMKYDTLKKDYDELMENYSQLMSEKTRETERFAELKRQAGAENEGLIADLERAAMHLSEVTARSEEYKEMTANLTQRVRDLENRLQSEIEAHEKQQHDFRQDIRDANETFERLQAERQSLLQARQQQLVVLQDENMHFSEQIQTLLNEKEKLREENQQLRRRISEMTSAHEEEVNQLEQSVQAHMEEISRVETDTRGGIEQLEDDLRQKDEKIDELQHRVETLEQENDELNAERVELSARVDQLEHASADVGKAQKEKINRLEEECRMIRSKLSSTEEMHDALRLRFESMSKDMSLSQEEHAVQMQDARKRYDALEEELRKSRAEYDTLKRERFKEVSTLQNELEMKEESLKVDSQDKTRLLMENEVQIERMTRELEAMKERLTDTMTRAKSIEEENARLRSEKSELEKSHRNLEIDSSSRIASLEEQLRTIERERSKMKESLGSLKDLRDKMNTQLSLAHEKRDVELQRIQNRMNELEKQLEDVNEQLYAKDEELDGLARERDELVEGMRAEEEERNTLLRDADDRVQHLASDNMCLKDELEKMKREMKLVKEQNAESAGDMALKLQSLEEINKNQNRIIESQHVSYDEEVRKLKTTFTKRSDVFEEVQAELTTRVQVLEEELAAVVDQAEEERAGFVQEIHEKEQLVSRLQREIREFSDIVRQLRDHVVGIEEQSQEMRKELDAAHDEHGRQTGFLQKEMKKMSEELYELRRRNALLSRDNDNLTSLSDKLRESTSALEREKTALEDQVSSQQVQLTSLQERIQSALSDVEEHHALQQQNLQAQLRSATDELSSLREYRDELEEQIRVLKGQRRDLQKENEDLVAKLQSQEEAASVTQETLREEVRVAKRMHGEAVSALSKTEKDCGSENRKLMQEIGTLREKVTEMREFIAQLERDKSRLESESEENESEWKRQLDELVAKVRELEGLLKEREKNSTASESELRARLEEKERQLIQVLSRVENLEAERESLETTLEETTTRHQDDVATLRKARTLALDDLSRQQKHVDSLRQKIDELSIELEDCIRKRMAAESKLSTLQAETESYRVAADQVEKSSSDVVAQWRQKAMMLESSVHAMREQRSYLQEQNARLNAEIDRLREENQQEVESVQSKHSDVERKLKESQDALSSTSASKDSMAQEIGTLRRRVSMLEADLEDRQRTLESMEREKSELQARIQDCEMTLVEREDEIARLEERIVTADAAQRELQEECKALGARVSSIDRESRLHRESSTMSLKLADRDKGDMQKKVDTLEQEKRASEARIAEIEGELVRVRRALQSLEDEKRLIAESHARQLRSMKESNSELSHQLKQTQDILVSTQAKLREAERARGSVRESDRTTEVVELHELLQHMQDESSSQISSLTRRIEALDEENKRLTASLVSTSSLSSAPVRTGSSPSYSTSLPPASSSMPSSYVSSPRRTAYGTSSSVGTSSPRVSGIGSSSSSSSYSRSSPRPSPVPSPRTRTSYQTHRY
eukprot:TRINITY_DN3694_c0_g1_i1.p1 TRINITY_DN3694_c0_g1~~TRINITY_DN3694_c0_g1_i1.p1  ORF type:complete len:2659 (+),score=963.64 TRINITY_DN3694_c0_g1_i1:179-8155(+)